MPRASLADIVDVPQGGRASLADIATSDIPDPSVFLEGTPAAEFDAAKAQWNEQLQSPFYGAEMLPPGGGRLLSAMKGGAGRLLTAGMAGAKAVFPKTARGIKAAGEAWKASAPQAAGVAKPAMSAATKPKLTAQQAKQMLRTQYGSEKGGQMLYGRARPGLKAADRQALMKSGTTGGGLPQSAQRAIEKELAASTPDEAFAYASRAPNAPAQSHIGDLLRQVLRERAGK